VFEVGSSITLMISSSRSFSSRMLNYAFPSIEVGGPYMLEIGKGTKNILLKNYVS
jgi:hypothetical protein